MIDQMPLKHGDAGTAGAMFFLHMAGYDRDS